MPLVRVCKADALKPGEAMRFEAARPIAIFRIGEEFLATDDTCTHAKSSLAEGYIEGEAVECAFHGARFCLRTGKALSLPATQPIRTYAVRRDGDDVLVDVE